MNQIHFPVVLDGATGTELQKFGYTGTECAEKWVLEHPDSIRTVQDHYIQAGSGIVYAATFSANRLKMEEFGLADSTEDYNYRLAGLSLEAAGRRALVGGDIAPTGHFLAPLGDGDFEEFIESYRVQAAGLAKAGVDMFAVETMMTIPDARAAVLAIRSVSDRPIFVTFTCDAEGRTLYGTDVAAALSIFEGMGVAAFGLNCSVGPNDMLTQIQRLAKTAHVPLIAKPNAGIPHVAEGRTVYDATPEDFRPFVSRFVAAGCGAVGGCCGTDPAFIQVISEEMNGLTMTAKADPTEGLLPLATGKELFLVAPGAAAGAVIDCSDDLDEDLEDEEDSEAPLTAIRFTSMDQIEAFDEYQYAVTKPLCILCEDAELLDTVLRHYQGRALYRGSLGEDVLAPLREKYGVLTD